MEAQTTCRAVIVMPQPTPKSMPPRKADPKQKPKPSKEVLAMVKVIKAKKATYRKREDFSEAGAQAVSQATEGK